MTCSIRALRTSGGSEGSIAPSAQPLESADDQPLYPFGERQSVPGLGRRPFLHGPHGFDHHERVPFAESPDALCEAVHHVPTRVGGGQVLHQRQRLRLGEQGQPHRCHHAVAVVPSQ